MPCARTLAHLFLFQRSGENAGRGEQRLVVRVGLPTDEPAPFHRSGESAGRTVGTSCLSALAGKYHFLSTHVAATGKSSSTNRTIEKLMSHVPKSQPGERRFSARNETKNFTSNQTGRKNSTK